MKRNNPLSPQTVEAKHHDIEIENKCPGFNLNNIHLEIIRKYSTSNIVTTDRIQKQAIIAFINLLNLLALDRCTNVAGLNRLMRLFENVIISLLTLSHVFFMS